MTPFFVQKAVLGVFTQIMMFSLKNVDDLRARVRERKEKGTTNSRPKTIEANKLLTTDSKEAS